MMTSVEVGSVINDDRLSKLPDDLLHHILSFLDAKIVVQTSVLASRWRYLWTSLPFINFQRQGFTERDHLERSDYVCRKIATFENFVRQFLSQRDAHTNVAQLSVVCLCDYNADYFFDWGFEGDGYIFEAIIDYVHPMRIRHFSITAFCSVKNLAKLYNCHCLTTLELTGLWIENPKFDSVTITNLRIESCFFTGCSEHTFDPFKGCVNLRSLDLNFWFYADTLTNKFEIFAPRLRDLTLFVDSLEGIHAYLVLELSTPMLTSFHYIPSNPIQFSINVNLPFLEELYIGDIYSHDHPDPKIACRLIKLFEGMGNAKFVTISPKIADYIMKIPGILDHRPSPFTRLQSLQSTSSSVPLDPNFMAYAGSPVV